MNTQLENKLRQRKAWARLGSLMRKEKQRYIVRRSKFVWMPMFSSAYESYFKLLDSRMKVGCYPDNCPIVNLYYEPW